MTEDPDRGKDAPGGPLGFGEDEERERWAHREDPDLRAERLGLNEEPKPEPRPRPFGGSRYGWLVGIAVLFIAAYILLNGLRTEGPGSTGVPANRPLPPFAMPLATGTLDGDANVNEGDNAGAAGRRPACSVRGPEILNICQLAERGPVVLVFLATRGSGACIDQLDTVERLRARFRGVQFAGVSIRGDRDGLRDLVRKRGWRFPVGFDRDGAVSNIYGVSACPTFTFAYPGGIVMRSYVGSVDSAGLAKRVAQLVAQSRKRGWTPPA